MLDIAYNILPSFVVHQWSGPVSGIFLDQFDLVTFLHPQAFRAYPVVQEHPKADSQWCKWS